MYKVEHNEHCKHIATELEEVAAGNMYKYDYDFYTYEELKSAIIDGEIVPDELEENKESGTFTDIETFAEDYIESYFDPVSMWDFFGDDIYNIEYRIDGNKEYRSVEIMVACGGPNIYIDTAKKAVCLYWWNEKGIAYLSDETVVEIDYMFEEMFNM